MFLRPWLARSLVTLLLSAGCAGALAPAGPRGPSAPSPWLSRPLPEIKARGVNGESVDTAALRGRVTVVKFFAKFCAPCRRTLPSIERLHEQRPEVAIVGVSEDERESDVRELMARYGLTFPIVLDRENEIAGRLGVTELPRSFVIDSSGVVRWVAGPDQSEEDLMAAVGALK